MKPGDIAPYRNSHGKVCMAEITELVSISSDRYWFRGIDIKTKAKVWYSCDCSEKLTAPATDTGNKL